VFGQEDLGLPGRLLRVFYAPRTSFAAVVGRESAHDWLLPVLLVCAVGLVSHHLILDITIASRLAAPAVQEQMERMSEEERAQYVNVLRANSWMEVPIGLFISLVVVAGVALALARWLFDGEITYQQMLVVKAYASLVIIPEWIVRTPLILARGTPEVHTGLGAFVSGELARTFAGRVLTFVNFFDIWQICVMGIGIAVMTDAPTKKATIALLVLWAFWIIGGAAVETMASGMPQPGPAP